VTTRHRTRRDRSRPLPDNRRRATGIAIVAALTLLGAASLAWGLVTGAPHTTDTKVATPTALAPVTTVPTKEPEPARLKPTKKPFHIVGGTFTVIGHTVKLTHIVARGDTMVAIAYWYHVTGGATALYRLRHSAIGKHPKLILVGERIVLAIPASTIPHGSPIWLADASA
jgi:hypothetical protein